MQPSDLTFPSDQISKSSMNRIGRGVSATVYKASWNKPDQPPMPVAIKVYDNAKINLRIRTLIERELYCLRYIRFDDHF